MSICPRYSFLLLSTNMATSASCYSTSCHEGALRSVIGSSGNTANSCNDNSENPTSSSFCERQTIPVVGNPTLGASDKGGGGSDGGGGIDLKETVAAEVRDGVCLSRVGNNNNSLKKWKMNLTDGTSIIDEKMVVNSDHSNNSIDSSDKNLNTPHAVDGAGKAPQTQLDNNSKGDIHQQGGDLVSQMYNENTVKKTKSCLRKLMGFFKSKGENRPLERIPSDRLDSLLCSFFKEARKLDGDEFEPMSLGAFQCALDRYLRQHKYPCDILSDHTFALSRGVLIARKKELRNKQLKKESERKMVHVNGDQQEVIDCSIQFCDSSSDQTEVAPDTNIRKTVNISNVQDPKRMVADPKEPEMEPITVPAQGSQNLEKVYENPSQPHMRNVLTVRKTISCVRRMTAFFFEKGEKRSVEQIPPNELDKLLCSFFREVKKLDGGEFEPMSLSAFQCALDRYLRDKNYPYNTLTDVDFALSRSVLNAKKKELKELSKGKRPNSSFELTPEEEDALWKEGVLGLVTNASSLQRTVWYFNRKLLGLKCNQESYELKWGDLQLKSDPLKGEYLVYNERIQKAKSVPPLLSVSCPKSDGNNNNMCTIWPDQKRTERCPIRFYKEFAKHRPHSACLPDSPFYLSVKLKRMPDDQIFYKNCNLGIHSLEKMLKLINLPTNTEGTLNSVNNSAGVCEQHYQYQKMSQTLQDVPISKAVSYLV